MSGHSKWHSIKHKKAATDAKRGKTFTKLANLISAAARSGGGDPSANIRLRMTIDGARKENMPKENIERAIKRGTGDLAGVVIEEFVIESFGPGGTGLMIEVITDNRNRTLADVRNIISKAGGTVANKGAVAHLFELKGVLRLPLTKMTDELEEALIDSGAEDYDFTDDTLTITTAHSDLNTVKKALDKFSLEPDTAQLEYVALTPIAIDAITEEKLLALFQALDDNDDVANVSSNAFGF